jgi:hypothetical protein
MLVAFRRETMNTIHYISDFKYFSGRKVNGKYSNVVDALRAHINYIGRKAKGVFTFNLNINDWIEKAKDEIKKRWDSRVALKFVIALPTVIREKDVENVYRFLTDFIAEQLNVNRENISIAIHLHKGISGNYNPHAHILIYPRTKNGKKLRIDRKKLQDFHREWDKRLKELGLKIKKDPEDLRLPHLGEKLYYDKEVQELYRAYLNVKRTQQEIETLKRLNHRRSEKEEEREGKEFEIKEGITDFFKRFFEGKEGKDFRSKQKRALAEHFRRLGYSPNDRLAVILVNHKTKDVLQRVFSVKEILDDKVLRFLSAKNAQGYSVYASVNVLKENAKRRRKEDFKKKQKRIYLDLDAKDLTSKELIAKFYEYLLQKGLPFPNQIVKSSKGNYQVYWILNEDLDFEVLEKIMERMNNDLGLDHTQDVSRVFRLPYFRNKKPNKDDLVLNIDVLKVFVQDKLIDEIRINEKPVTPKPFLSLLKEPKLPPPKPLSIEKEIDISGEIDKFWKDFKKKQEEQTLNSIVYQLIKQGYSEKVAKHRAIIANIISKIVENERLAGLYPNLTENVEVEQLLNIAFERNKSKTPSEVDLALFGLLFSKYNGEPPSGLLYEIRELLIAAARERGKVNAYDYVKRTEKKARDYWKRKNQTTRKVRTRDKGSNLNLNL